MTSRTGTSLVPTLGRFKSTCLLPLNLYVINNKEADGGICEVKANVQPVENSNVMLTNIQHIKGITAVCINEQYG